MATVSARATFVNGAYPNARDRELLAAVLDEQPEVIVWVEARDRENRALRLRGWLGSGWDVAHAAGDHTPGTGERGGTCVAVSQAWLRQHRAAVTRWDLVKINNAAPGTQARHLVDVTVSSPDWAVDLHLIGWHLSYRPRSARVDGARVVRRHLRAVRRDGDLLIGASDVNQKISRFGAYVGFRWSGLRRWGFIFSRRITAVGRVDVEHGPTRGGPARRSTDSPLLTQRFTWTAPTELPRRRRRGRMRRR